MTLLAMVLNLQQQRSTHKAFIEHGQRMRWNAREQIGGIAHLVFVVLAKDGISEQVRRQRSQGQ